MMTKLDDLSRDELLALLRDQGETGLRLTFTGKSNARKIARLVRPRVMGHLPKHSVGSPQEQAANMIVEGENLQSLTTLFRFRGEVDLILTDPPYNTGEDFRYNDRWDEDPNDPDLGALVPAEDGSRHTKWMKFMYPRLMVMRDMLKPTGVLAICIDHRELFRLGAMLDEIFQEENRLGILNWQKTTAKNDARGVATTTEYILVYARDAARSKTGLLPRSEKANRRFANPDGDVLGDWKQGDLAAQGDTSHARMVYGIQSPFTGQLHFPPTGRHWAAEKKRMKKWLEEWGVEYVERKVVWHQDASTEARIRLDAEKALVIKNAPIPGEDLFGATHPALIDAAQKAAKRLADGNWPHLYFGRDGLQQPVSKVHLSKVKDGAVPTTYWADEDYGEPFDLGVVSWASLQTGRSREGVTELDSLLGKGHGFQTVKPLKLFKKVIQLWCPPSGLVIDPFAGSGTTGHAVLDLNRESGAARRFVLVEQGRPERGDPYARSLTAERVRRAITGERPGSKRADPLPGGFSFMALKDTVDAKAVLAMERDEMADAVIASHFDAARRGGPGLVSMRGESFRYLVARNADAEGFFLVWDGAGASPVFDEDVYEAVVQEALAAKLKPVYHVYARFNLYQSDDVRFYQIPTRILIDFGLNEAQDAFNNAGECK